MKSSFDLTPDRSKPIPFLDIAESNRECQDAYDRADRRVMDSGRYVLVEQPVRTVLAFEANSA